MKKLIALLVLLLVLPGCATKRYGRMQDLTGYETSRYTLDDIDMELAKIEAFELQVAKGSEFNLLSVASFLGDYGIGNTIEKNAALRTAKERKVQLLNLKAQKEHEKKEQEKSLTKTSGSGK